MPDTFTVDELGARKAGIDATGQRTYVRRWRVTTPSADYGARAVLGVCPVGLRDVYRIGTKDSDGNPIEAYFEEDILVYCNGVEAEQTDVAGDEDGINWIVTATYGYIDFTKQENPLDDPPELSWSFASYNRIADRAYDDDGALTVPIVNTAGDPFDPPTEIDDQRPILTVVVNLPYPDGFSPAQAYEYRNAVNADEFFAVPAGYVKALPPVAQRLYHAECGFYWKVTYEFHFNPDGWLRTLLNQGTRQLNDAGDGYEPILHSGVPISDPVPLNEGGQPLAPDGDPIFMDFTVYPVKPFVTFFGFGGPAL